MHFSQDGKIQLCRYTKNSGNSFSKFHFGLTLLKTPSKHLCVLIHAARAHTAHYAAVPCRPQARSISRDRMLQLVYITTAQSTASLFPEKQSQTPAPTLAPLAKFPSSYSQERTWGLTGAPHTHTPDNQPPTPSPGLNHPAAQPEGSTTRGQPPQALSAPPDPHPLCHPRGLRRSRSAGAQRPAGCYPAQASGLPVRRTPRPSRQAPLATLRLLRLCHCSCTTEALPAGRHCQVPGSHWKVHRPALAKTPHAPSCPRLPTQ
jgi:hypothetical protein